ncbi:MAG: hypothetical protein ABEJ31_07380 [Haloarculaceae archaeon]
MTRQSIERLAQALDRDDARLRDALPEVLPAVEEDLMYLLVDEPDSYQRLIERVCALENLGEYAAAEPETVDRFLAILWNGVGTATNVVPEVGAAVTDSFRVNWEARDAEVAFHAVADADDGTIDGGPGLLDDADVTFRGSTDVLFRMLGDGEFDATLAYVQNRYEVLGSLEDARAFGQLMDEVTGRMEDVA